MAAAVPEPFRVLRHDTVTSTNDLAREHAENGATAGLVVTAARQTAGRGRHGRSWESPSGNLYASLLLRPSLPMAEAATLSLVVALLLAEYLSERLGDLHRAQVKWPNDVLVDGSKVAGILLEGAAQPDGACRWLVVGIGVNLARSPGQVAGYPAIDLKALGLSLEPDATLTFLLTALASALPLWEAGGFAPFRERWLARAAGRGQPIELRLGHGAVKGIFVDVDTGGALCARLPTGEIQRHAAGELVLV